MQKNNNKSMLVILIKSMCILLCIISVFYIFFIRPTILTILDYQGKLYCTRALTDAVSQLLDSNDIECDDFVTINKDEKGRISSVKTNGKNVNLFKNDMMKKLSDEMNSSEKYHYNIPIGTLLGSELLLGRGPCVVMRIVPTGYPTVNLVSRFEAAGINQTKHSIIMNVSLSYTSIIPFNKIAEKIQSEFIISETLIIGEVPQFYSN